MASRRLARWHRCTFRSCPVVSRPRRLLVFVDVMKELPATFAMRPFNFDTLAVEAYNLAKDERIAEAAIPSLVMVGIALLPLILLLRQISRSSLNK